MKSGMQCQVQRRFACPKFLRQTFQHHATLRKLARSWIRILFRVWQTRAV
jgi:hypothetical protein